MSRAAQVRKRKGTVWHTPQAVFDKLNDEFRFQVDLCADPDNKKLPNYLSRERSLDQDWIGIGWLNPPYGKEIGMYLRKAVKAMQKGATVVALVPTRTNAPWWHDYAMAAEEIRFIRKKLSFQPHKGVPFTGHAILVFRDGKRFMPQVFSWDQP